MTLVWKCISEITIIQAKIYQMRLVFLQYTTKALLWYDEQCKMGEEVEKHEYLFIFTWSWEPNSYYTMVWFTKYLKKKNRYTFDLIIALKVPPKAFVYELQIMALLQIIRYNKSTENILKAEAEWAP